MEREQCGRKRDGAECGPADAEHDHGVVAVTRPVCESKDRIRVGVRQTGEAERVPVPHPLQVDPRRLESRPQTLEHPSGQSSFAYRRVEGAS